jgi:adenine/guanine phosphoribosyltransferase-like PRPP-binding protein/uncharacterized HAD superfamily protein
MERNKQYILNMRINWVTNADLCNIIRQNLYKIPHDIDGVICIPRGGLFVGTIIAEYLHKPMYILDSFANNKTIGNGKAECGLSNTNFGRYVVIDDSVSSGESFRKANETLKQFPYKFIYIACIGKQADMPSTDIILSVVPEFRLFELNFFRSSWVSHCIFDIDGVLCKDPEYGIDLDEDRYIDHIKNVPALIPLQFPVKAICTHRLYKYLEPTREWLSKNGIGYNMIYMLDYPTIEDKIKNANNPVYLNMKSNVYNLYPDAILFVESNYNEAMRIYQNTHRPVLCTDANIILQD